MRSPLVGKNALTALKRLARPGMALREDGRGGFAVSLSDDMRRRAVARVSAVEVRAMASEGLIDEAAPGRFQISAAGRVCLARSGAQTSEGADETDYAPRSAALRRLRALSAAGGSAWFNVEELSAAERLVRDHRLAQLTGRVTADWAAPPMTRGARPASADLGPEAAMDARNRLARIRTRIGKDASAFLEDVFAFELGMEEAERRRNWPPRSGKVALKLILGVLCEMPRGAA